MTKSTEGMPLKLDVHDLLRLEPTDFRGKRVVMLGTPGSGKSNSAARLVEQLIPYMPFTVIDPEGEHWGLAEKFDAIVVSDDPSRSRVPVRVEIAAALAELSFTRGISVILDFSEDESLMMEFCEVYLDALWRLTSAYSTRKPYGLLVEEARVFAPQSAKATPIQKVLRNIASRGRKRGLTTILTNQRAASLDKELLNYSDYMFLHQTYFPTDVDVYCDLVPKSRAEVREMVDSLRVGEAIYRHQKTVEIVQIRLRETVHGGSTPDFDPAAAPQLRQVDSSIVEPLLELLEASDSGAQADGEGVRLRAQIAELKRKLESRAVEKVVERVEVPVLSEDDAYWMKAYADQCHSLGEAIVGMGNAVLEELRRLSAPGDHRAEPVEDRREQPERSQPAASAPAINGHGQTGDRLHPSAERILVAVARRHPAPATRSQAAVLARFAPKGGAYLSHLKALKDYDLIVEEGGKLTVTPVGLNYLGLDIPQPQSPQELLDMWLEALNGGEQRLLKALMEAYPRSLSRADLAQMTNFTVGGGAFNAALATLRNNGLARVDGQQVRASETFFLEEVHP